MNKMDATRATIKQLKGALAAPPAEATVASRRRIETWFASVAPVVQWDVIDSPLGPLYLAAREGRLCSVGFGVDEATFLAGLDPLARTERDVPTLAPIAAQMRAYFGDPGRPFDVPVDLARTTAFQRRVLTTIRRIPVGAVWTYSQVATEIGNPKASRAVGQALGRNPVPIVIPCHRVIASDGSLGGYSAGGGLASKRLLLRLESSAVQASH